MNKTIALATLAVSLLSVPALADDNNLANLEIDSGRIVAMAAPAKARVMTNAYASGAPAHLNGYGVRQDAGGQFQGSNEATRFAPEY